MACCFGKTKENVIENLQTPLDIAIASQFPGHNRDFFLKKLPNTPVISTNEAQTLYYQHGPNVEGNEEEKSQLFTYHDLVSMKSVSTYPLRKVANNGYVREGDPNADHFAVEIYPTRAIVCIADGCGWGQGPHLASLNATRTFVQYLKQNHHMIKNLRDAGLYLFNATNAANDEIVKHYDEYPGTTTILGGILLQVQKNNSNAQWAFVFINIGDCKVFRWISKSNQVIDLTGNNRLSLNATDPGGRLGPADTLDVRNLSLSYTECDEQDIIFMVSDGVHDNGPLLQGLSPNDIDKSLPNDWKDITPEKLCLLNTEWILNIIKSNNEKQQEITPTLITNKLVNYSLQTTKPSRDFLENKENEHKRLPIDLKQFPGKMDHCTCLSIRVGKFQ
jgi:hypothetical protein